MRLVLFLISTLAIAAEYTTYIGDIYPRTVAAIATDAAGNTYVVGNRGNPNIPTAILGGFLSIIQIQNFFTAPPPPNDVFVSKFDPTGKVLFTNVFAGKGFDQGLAVAVDATGNIYAAGTTTSVDFPISNALQTQPSPYGTGFIVKLSPDGKTILYSTYFGGLQGYTAISAMTTDASGNLYLAGTTYAADFPHTAGMPTAAVTQNGIPSTSGAFVTSISAAGDKVLFSGIVAGLNTVCSTNFRTCVSLPTSTTGIALALDASRNVYFGGNTNTFNIPTTTGAFLQQGMGAFAGKITANGTGLAYLTYLGSTLESTNGPLMMGSNVLSSLTVDSAGNAYLAGNTGDPKFPAMPGAYQTTFAGGPVDTSGVPANTDGFVAKLNPTGSALVWATYLGGNGNDVATSMAVDTAGDVWVAGTTASTDFPNAQGWSQGGDFLVEFNPSGSGLSYSARYPNGTVSQAVALDSTTFIHTAGAPGIVSQIASTAPPTKKIFGIQNAAGGQLAGRVSPAEIIAIYGPHIGPATAITATPTGGFYPTTLGGVQVTTGGLPAPLLYASDGQINAVVPMGVTKQSAATIQIGTASFPLWIDSTDTVLFPGLFNQDGTLNSQTNPAKEGSLVSFYTTGWQSNFAPLTDGQVATKAMNACTPCASPVIYEGPVPGVVEGLTQFNILVQPISTNFMQQVSTFVSDLGMVVTYWVVVGSGAS